jgi:Ni,Fe-hydrogenase I cytochrome b subunit
MKLEIGVWLAHSINFICIVLLVAGALYVTKSLWSLLGLVFLPSMSTGRTND